MSVYFNIQANSPEEYEALESEGAPWCNVSNSVGQIIVGWLTGEKVEDYAGSLNPEEVLDNIPVARKFAAEYDLADGPKWVLTEDGGKWANAWENRVNSIQVVLIAAQRLGRNVIWG